MSSCGRGAEGGGTARPLLAVACCDPQLCPVSVGIMGHWGAHVSCSSSDQRKGGTGERDTDASGEGKEEEGEPGRRGQQGHWVGTQLGSVAILS